MKVIKYTLTSNGTIPLYVVDGGHMPSSNGGVFPQDTDLIGIAIDSAPETAFANKEELLAYAQTKDFKYKMLLTNEDIPIENVVDNIWSKLTSIFEN